MSDCLAVGDELLTKIKTSLRISHTALDDDLRDTIMAAVYDLKVCGVQATYTPGLELDKISDPLLLQAVKLYCKAIYTGDPDKAARYQAGYDALKAHLMMAVEYRED